MLDNLLFAVIYAAVGIVLLLAGAWVFDLLTPGKLASLLFPYTEHWKPEERRGEAEPGSGGAGLVLGATLLGQAAVIFTAVWTNGAGGHWPALGWTVAFGALGIVLNAVAFTVLDVVTPGRLGDAVCRRGPATPPAYVAAAALLAIAAIVCASIA